MYKEIDELPNGHLKACLKWILMISLSPLALLLFLLMALYSLLRFLYKITLLFIIIAINTPFAVMFNLSVLVFQYNLERRLARFRKSSSRTHWNWSDPRASLGIEVKLLVSDFFKVVAGELLVAVSAGIITYFTAPRKVFYASTAFGLVATLHKWFNEKCMSVTALSCLFDGYGLSPLMFLFSYIGFFDIGCHPIAKCSFPASRAFLFVKGVPNRANEEVSRGLVPERVDIENNVEQGQSRLNEEGLRPVVPSNRLVDIVEPEPGDKELDVEQGQRGLNEEGFLVPQIAMAEFQTMVVEPVGNEELDGNKERKPFDGAAIETERSVIEFLRWNAFERGLFQLNPRINFISPRVATNNADAEVATPSINRHHGKYILKSSMVLKLLGNNLCEYLVERLELPEDYSKTNELFNFLDTLSEEDGFVTNKMGGRYEHSLSLLEITEGVEENDGYRIVKPMDKMFIVAGCTNMQ